MSRWRTWGEIPTFMKNDFTLKILQASEQKEDKHGIQTHF